MEQVNTLEAFDNLVASGVPTKQARAHVKELNISFTGIATKQDLLLMEANLKQFVTWEIVMLLLALLALPPLSERLQNIFRRK